MFRVLLTSNKIEQLEKDVMLCRIKDASVRVSTKWLFCCSTFC